MVQSNRQSIDNVSEQAGRVAGYTEQATEAAKEYASEAADRVTTIAKEAYENPERFIAENRDRLTKYTQEKPLEALAIAAGVAFVVGALWKR